MVHPPSAPAPCWALSEGAGRCDCDLGWLPDRVLRPRPTCAVPPSLLLCFDPPEGALEGGRDQC